MNNDSEKPTIMVVDDTPANLDLLAQLLEDQGYRVRVFPRGTMALKAVAENSPDLILLDIMMPEMDGFEVCRRLKADETLKEVPVIFISALDDVENKVRAFSGGGVDYVPKPFQAEEVLARVRTHLSLRRMQRELTRHNLHLEDLVREKVKEISDSQLATILAVSRLAESRDDDTGRHIERTRTYCRMLTETLRDHPRYAQSISEAYVENIFHATPLHDIGKVGIMDSILLKPGKLTPEEFETMKTHTVIGAGTLQTARSRYPKNAFINMGIAVARSHHERWDGTGYPDGLAGEDIPLAGRIMALADVYDALRSKRPYKPDFPHEKSCDIILAEAGKQFDPVLVETFKGLEAKFAEIREKMGDQ